MIKKCFIENLRGILLMQASKCWHLYLEGKVDKFVPLGPIGRISVTLHANLESGCLWSHDLLPSGLVISWI